MFPLETVLKFYAEYTEEVEICAGTHQPRGIERRLL